MGITNCLRHCRGLGLLAAVLLTTLVVSSDTPVSQAEHLSRGCRQGRRIALTFDDGPNPPYTDHVLDILAAYDVRGTFFVEGKAVETRPDFVNRETAAGMAVGAHSYGHSKDLPNLSRTDFARDLRQVENVLTPLLGYKPGLYRSPYGHTGQNMLDELRAEGYVSIGWGLDSTDWSNATADQVVSSVLDHVQSGDIILMHDGGLGGGNPDRSTTIAALPRIIEGLRERGYSFSTVPELTGAPSAHGSTRRPMCSTS
jgi:peptidoglycan/xylan/chitin deacetylase (PgdA/CDA1 family)